MDLPYLIANRLKPTVFSGVWFKVWGKRAFSSPSLAILILRDWIWRRKGVKMGLLAGLGECTIAGRPSLLSIGEFSFVGRASIQLLDSVIIGNSAVINDNVTILTGTHDVNDVHFRLHTKPVAIGNYCWICTGATILPGVTVKEGGVVAAAAVVTKDVPAYHTVAGNPAKIVRTNRAAVLDYKPNLLRACYEAWVGIPDTKK